MYDPFAEFEKTVLPNGLEVYIRHMHGRPWEYVSFVVHGGAEHDPVGKEGLTHFVEHMASGNASVSRDEMCAFAEERGGGCNLGATSFLKSTYGFLIPYDDMTTMMGYFSSMLTGANLAKGIEHERKIIIREFYNRHKYRPERDPEFERYREVLEGHALARMRSVLGMPHSIQEITGHDIQTAYNARYVPANITVIAVGGMPQHMVLDVMAKSCLGITAIHGVRMPLPGAGYRPPDKKWKGVVMHRRDEAATQETESSCSYHSLAAISGSIKSRAVNLTKMILDHVLFDTIRNAYVGTYSIGAEWENHGSCYTLRIICPEFSVRLKDMMEELVQGCIQKAGADEKLFARKKRKSVCDAVMGDYAAAQIIDDAVWDIVVERRIITLAEWIKRNEAVTMDDVRAVLACLAPDRRYTQIIVP